MGDQSLNNEETVCEQPGHFLTFDPHFENFHFFIFKNHSHITHIESISLKITYFWIEICVAMIYCKLKNKMHIKITAIGWKFS